MTNISELWWLLGSFMMLKLAVNKINNLSFGVNQVFVQVLKIKDPTSLVKIIIA